MEERINKHVNSLLERYPVLCICKEEIIQAVKYYKPKEEYTYYEPAICTDLLRQILNGEYHDR